MKKLFSLSLILYLIFVCCIFTVSAIETDNIDDLESDIKNELLGAIDDNVLDILEEMGIEELDFENVYNISFENITSFFSDTMLDKIRICFSDFFELLSIVIIAGLLSALFQKDAKENYIDLLSVIILTLLTVNTISETLSAVVSVLQMSGKFMLSFVPLYTLLISLSGNPASALTYNTFIIGFAEFISYIITSGVTDILGIFFSFSVSFSLNPSINVSRLISALNKFVSVALGLMASLFSGFLSLKSILSASVDSISVKGIRFLLGSLIPIIGSSISDAYSSLLGSINIIKSSVAVVGILVIIIINVPVIFETLAYYISFSMLSYIAEALSANRVGDIFKCFSCGIRILMLICIFEMFVLIISTGVLLTIKNGG